MRTRLSKILFMIIVVLILAAKAIPVLAEPFRREQILAATVRITIYTPVIMKDKDTSDDDSPIPPDEKRPMRATGNFIVSEGLGTVLIEGSEVLIVTHDHWSLLDRDLGKVQFRNSANELILEMDLTKYRQLIRKRDGGTTVIEAPQRLASYYRASGFLKSRLVLALAAPTSTVKLEDHVLIVRHQPGNEAVLQLTEAVVESLDLRMGQPAFRLRNLDGEPITGGDSGGGIWHNGKLVGNMWKTIMLENSKTSALRPSNYSLAAIFS
jgi:hypothetical protein